MHGVKGGGVAIGKTLFLVLFIGCVATYDMMELSFAFSVAMRGRNPAVLLLRARY